MLRVSSFHVRSPIHACDALSSVTLSAATDYIGWDAFGDCPKLKVTIIGPGDGYVEEYMEENGIPYKRKGK